MNQLTLIDQGFPSEPGMDVAVSHAILRAVARGEMGPTLRLHIPGAIVAFGKADRVTPGYRYAIRAAEAHGFGAVERLAGGRAAVFHEKTLAFSWAVPDANPTVEIAERFQIVATLMKDAFSSFGIDARIGEIPGEYCPGEFSVNVAGSFKVMGVGQRITRGAAHVGGVVVVDDSDRIRDILVPVYRALRLDWDPRTAGALADRAPGVDVDNMAEAIAIAFGTRFDLKSGSVPDSVVAAARDRADEHLPQVA